MSEGFNLERKADIGEMWLLARGRGERYIFTRKPKIWNRFSEKTGAQSVIRHGPLFKHGPKIFRATSHMVGYNKLCGAYWIFRLDLNYIMGSPWPWTMFELLELLSAVNMKLYVCHKRIEIIQGSFGHFYALTEF